MCVIVEAGCASTRVVQSALRDRLGFALLMVVAGVAPFLDATRVHVISFSVQLMVVESDASMEAAPSRRLVDPVYAHLMVVVDGVLWRDAISLLSLLRSFV